MFVSPGLFWALGVTQGSCTLLTAATAQEGRGSERALPGPGGYGVPKDFPVEPCFCRTPLCLRTLWMPEELSCRLVREERVLRGMESAGAEPSPWDTTPCPALPHMDLTSHIRSRNTAQEVGKGGKEMAGAAEAVP